MGTKLFNLRNIHSMGSSFYFLSSFPLQNVLFINRGKCHNNPELVHDLILPQIGKEEGESGLFSRWDGHLIGMKRDLSLVMFIGSPSLS